MAKKIHRTMIGGQAVIEGVMMRGVDKMAMAVRKPDGTINLDVWPSTSVRGKYSPYRIPIVRGVFNFVEMLVFGYKTLSRSAEIAGLEAPEDCSSTPAEGSSGQTVDKNDTVDETVADSETGEQTPSAADKIDDKNDTADKTVVDSETEDLDTNDAVNNNETGTDSKTESSASAESNDDDDSGGISKAAMDGITLISLVLGFAIAIFLFVVLPTLIVGKFAHLGMFRTLVEGVIKIAIFIAYLALIALMKDVQRLYQYHGAEHKTIYCYEHGDELTPENARKYIRFHPRCGTSFLLIVLIVSIILFSFLTWKTLWLRIVLKLLLLPVVVGISYEIIKFAGRHDNSVMRFLLAPGLWLQRLTTREPDDSQLEVAIKSIKAVLTENPEDDRW